MLALCVVAPAGLAAALLTVPGPDLDPALLALTLSLCTAAGAFEVLWKTGTSYQPALAFFIWGALLLPAWTVPMLAVAMLATGIVRDRPSWYTTVFNLCALTLAGLGAHVVGQLLGPPRSPGTADVLATGVAALVAVLIGHALIAAVTWLSDGRSPLRGAGDLAEALPRDAALALTGAVLAELWLVEPILLALAAGPAVLVHQALLVPRLRHQSRTDSKTGLYDPGQFHGEAVRALAYARRDEQALAVVLCNIDHLNAVNNRFGHLAGDDVIRRIARMVRQGADRRGMAARLGGDEFAVLLPGRSRAKAQLVAEQLRARVATEEWVWDGQELPVSLSLGVAAFPDDGSQIGELLDAAGRGLHDAKLSGRNRVRAAAPVTARADVESQRPPAATDDHRGGTDGGHGRKPGAAAADGGSQAAPHGGQALPEGVPRRVRLFAAVVAVLALAAGLTGSPAGLLSDPITFAALVAAVLVLDAVAIDIFQRGRISLAAAPILVIAYSFGAVGVLIAEGTALVVALLRRGTPLVKAVFDFGACTLAGTAAALVFAGAAPATTAGQLGAATLAGQLGAATLAALAYYVVNASLLCTISAMAEGTTARAVLRERFSWLWVDYLTFGLLAGAFLAFQEVGGPLAFLVAGAPLVALWISERQYVDRSRESVQELRERGAALEHALEVEEKLRRDIQDAYLSTITSLARTIEAKDPYTGGHTERVSHVAVLLASELGMGDADLRAVRVGAVIHDIGKIGVPDAVLLKPGALDDDEFKRMKEHPVTSSRIIDELDLPPIVPEIVRSHHERYEGGGYPDGLSGKDIPVAARIVAVADTLDAMTSARAYRSALPLDIALAEIRGHAGRQFCPEVVAALDRCLDRDPTLGNAYPQAEHRLAVAQPR